MGVAEEEAWVTLATNDTYALGALVLAHSIRRAGTTRRLVALVTPGVTMAMRDQLSATFDVVEMVNVLDSGDTANLALLSRPDLGITFTKLHCWRLTQFSKCVFLDADTLVLHPCDELFDREELSAAPDAGWPDCFNSGVFVFKPSNETYQQLIKFAVSHGSFDGGDQGLLNSFFSDWATKDISRHLPFIYNMCSTATYSYLPAYKKFGETVRIAHFIGAAKPWMQSFDSETRKVRVGPGQDHQRLLLQIWWDIFCHDVHPYLSLDMRHRTSLIPQLENSTPAHFVYNLFEKFPPNSFEPHPSHFDDEESWVQNTELPISVLQNIEPQNTEPSLNPSTEPIACLPNLPRDDPVTLPCNDQPGEAATDPSGGNSEPPCMEVSLEPQIPLTPPPQPSPQQSSVCLRPPSVTVGMVEEQAKREASLHSVENAGVPQCADPSPETEGGLAAAFSQMTLGAPKSDHQRALEEHLRREAWEVGQIDYLGQDSFDNVWKRIMETISSGPASSSQPAPVEPPPAQPAPTLPPSVPIPPPQPTPPPLQATPPQPTLPPPQPTSSPPQPTPLPTKPSPPQTPSSPKPTLLFQPAPPSPKPTPPSQATPPSPKPTPPSQATPPSPKPTPPSQATPPSPKPTPPSQATPPSPKPTSPSQPAPPSPTKPTPPPSPQSTPVTPPLAAALISSQKKPGTPTQKEPKVLTPVSPEPVSPSQPSAPPPTPVKPTAPTSPQAAPSKAASSGAAKVASPEQKEASSTAPAGKSTTSKASPGAAQEEAAKGTAPVAPKRKSAAASQQQGGSGRGKSAGQKGKK